MTERASANFRAYLLTLLEEASEGLPHVTVKRLFGCDGLFASDKIYALVWATGRLGLKITDLERFAEIMAMPGSEPWSPNGTEKGMSHWVLVPESFHDDRELLTEWTHLAHHLAETASAAPPKVRKATGATAKAAPEKVAKADTKTAAKPAVHKPRRTSSAS